MDKKYLDEYINLEYSDIKEDLTPEQVKLIKASIGFNRFLFNKRVEEITEILVKEFKRFFIK